MTPRTFLARLGPAAIVLALAAGAAHAAESVTTRAALHDGFGRIVFDWGEEVEFEAGIEDDVLRVRFPRAMEADLDLVRRRLAPYVESAELSSDGRTASFPLNRPMQLRAFQYRNAVVLDLVETAPAAGGEAAPALARTGEHPGFSRVVFDWKRFVDYSVDREGDRVTVTFSDSGPLDLSRLAARLPRLVRSAEGASDGARTVVVLGVPADSRVRNFRLGTRIVVDVLGDGAERPARIAEAIENAPAAPELAVPPPAPVAGEASAPALVSLGATVEASGPAAVVPRAVAAMEPKALAPPRRLVPLPQRELDPGPEIGLAVDAESAAAAPAPPAARPGSGAESAPPPRLEAPARADVPLPRKVAGVATAAPPGAGASFERPAAEAALKVDFVPTPGGARLIFAWPEPVAAAVFRRAGYLWVVFDELAGWDLSAITPDPAGPVIAADQVPHRRATLLRFRLQPGLYPAVTRKEATWVVDLAEEASGVAHVIKVKPEPHAAMGARLFLPVVDLGERIEVTDPEVGDRLVTVPLEAAESGIAIERDFLEVKVLATAQGVAITPKTDDVEVRLLRNGVVITREDGLRLSGADGRRVAARAEPTFGVDRARSLLLRFDDWRRGAPERFIEINHELLRGIAEAPAEERNEPRLKLAQFYFAHGFAADAKGVLVAIAEHDAKVASNRGFRALSGAVDFLLNNFDVADKVLFHADFDGNREVAVWRGATAASHKQWTRAADAFALGAGAVESYPKDLRIRFLTLEARTALAVGDIERLDSILAVLGATDPPEDVRVHATYLRGAALERLGHLDAALENYERAASSANRPIAARAKLARVSLLRKRGDLTADQAIDRLSGLRFAWRGDDFELALLKTLGELYIEQRYFRDGLNTLRQAVTYFPKDATTRAIAQKMNEVFEGLFLGRGADALTPVSALGLYYEFRELTPLGAEGDEMIRRLADRLVAIDLLDRAAKLLEHQVKYRLEGGEKARVGARLVVVQLLDKRPKAALRALAETRWTSLAPDLADERRRLEARALADLGRYPEALVLLGQDEAPEAGLLRGEIQWRARDWKGAAQTFEALLGEMGGDEESLSASQHRHLMQLAVSLALAGDQAGLDRVRERYAEALAPGAEADAFRLITGKVDRGATQFRQLAGKIAEVDNVQAFMASYREKLANGGFSAIN